MASNVDFRRQEFFRRVGIELDRAYMKHGSDLWGRHEFKGILDEEFFELVKCVDQDLPTAELETEMVQVAAMCIRYFETGNRYAKEDRFLQL